MFIDAGGIVRKMNTINDDEPSNDADSPPMTSSRSYVAYGTHRTTGATGCEDNAVDRLPIFKTSKRLKGISQKRSDRPSMASTAGAFM